MAEIFQKNNDMQKMQEEAIKRVRDMQRRAKISVDTSVVKDTNSKNHKQKNTDLKKEDKGNPISSIFDSLMSDSERTMILILILILSSEEADMGLILALMYLII